MATKHEQIIRYIKKLEVGEKISVRQVAKELSVSDGTAYRAIKEAENRKLVNTIERVGTIRIEKKKRESIERLTFAEVLNIVDGQVLGGRSGLHKTLTKFVIGAMQLGDMMRYVDAGSLLIVGNRARAQANALQANAAVLITGGFDATDEAKKIADELELPIISTTYDTFTVATMLNRAIYDQMIEKEILLVSDILTPIEETVVLTNEDTILQFNENNKESGHLGYPVTDEASKLVGIITSRDIIGKKDDVKIDKVMTRNPITVTESTTVASAAHNMIWEGIDLLPVVTAANHLIGIVSREDVLRAFQTAQRQPHQGETIEDIIKSQMEIVSDDIQAIEFTVTPQLTNQYGTLSHGAMTVLLSEAGSRAIRARKRGEAVAENFTIYLLQPVQLGTIVRAEPRILQMSRRFVKVDFDLYAENEIVAKAMVMYQLFDK